MTPTPPTLRRAFVAALASAALCLSLLAAQPALAQSTPDPAASASAPAPSESPTFETPTPTPTPAPTDTDTASPSPEPTTPEDVETPAPEATDTPSPTPSPSTTGGAAIAAAAAFSATLAEAWAAVAGFQAGNIINDATFTNKNTMSASAIDTFFRKMVGTCQSGYTCLKDYRQNTPNRAADSYCSGYSGAANESAATIIAKVSQSCNINPQVLIVMLQKEQGLVTHTWPSQWRYDMALGQGCPDTAPCDPAFAGFFYQIYGAARQMNIYMEGRYFTYYPAGRTSNIYWHPNASCGTAPVYISNKATSALYYYTPYQPNRAALNAGYGEGDGCSSYGNRNFYLYFTQWFGSTQGGGSTPTTPSTSALARAEGRNEVYVLQGGSKFYVASSADLLAWASVLGGVQVVSTSAIDSAATGTRASRYVHDPRSGTLYLIEADGTKHRFSDATAIATYGYSFSSYVNLDAGTADRFRTGDPVGALTQASGNGDVYLLQDGTRRHVADMDALRRAYDATGSTYIATMDSAAAARIPRGSTYFVPNRLVKEQSRGDVYLTLASGRVLHIPSFALAQDLGATVYTIVPNGELARSPKAPGNLSPFITCGGSLRVLDRGGLAPVAKLPSGWKATALTTAECAQFAKRGTTQSAPLFVQAPGAAEVYYLDRGTLRHVRTITELHRLNGGRPLVILSWSAGTTAAAPVGAPVLAEGSFVQFVGKAEVYRSVAGTLRHVPTFELLTTLGGGRVPPIEFLPASQLSAYTIGSPLS